MKQKYNIEPKPLFLQRMEKLLGKEMGNYLRAIKSGPPCSIRANTLKTLPEELRDKLEKKGWKIREPWPGHPEIMIVESELEPGELGRALEHLLGYYYVQDLASMLPIIALLPKPNETVLDLAASPGSKTTQIASQMNNNGLIIANEVNLGRIKILASNLERCGVTNCIITRKDGIALCNALGKENFSADKILLDAPCSGEGTLRSTPKTSLMWNINTVYSLSGLQKKMIASAIKILKPGGELVYSTCTHAPEENEEVIDFALKNFPEMKMQKLSLPVKFREGVTQWEGKTYSPQVKQCARIYPQDNDTEGFFVAKLKKTE